MKSSERRCHALTIFENVHGAKMEKGMYTNLYTEIWDSMIFRDMVNKCTMNTKPAKMAVCDFVILREILGLSSSLSALHFFRLSEDYAENIANRRNSNELRRFLFPDSLVQTTKKEAA